jgi:hypothetical protein
MMPRYLSISAVTKAAKSRLLRCTTGICTRPRPSTTAGARTARSQAASKRTRSGAGRPVGAKRPSQIEKDRSKPASRIAGVSGNSGVRAGAKTAMACRFCWRTVAGRSLNTWMLPWAKAIITSPAPRNGTCTIGVPAARVQATMLMCGRVAIPEEPNGMLPAAARARATTSPTVRSPELRGVIITSGASLTWQIGCRSAGL